MCVSVPKKFPRQIGFVVQFVVGDSMIIFDWLIRRSRLLTSTVDSARKAKVESQAKIERIELGWRKRYDETREQHLKLMDGLVKIRSGPPSYGCLSFVTTIDERMLGCGVISDPRESEQYMRYVA